MSRKIPEKETKAENKKKILITVSAIGIIIILFLVFKIFTKTEDTSNNNTTEKKMQTENSFPFKKQGELSFLTKGDKIISTIDIEIAATDETREQGLMYRTSMEENQGMLFIFTSEEMQAFWMKNTILPLDIIFVNAKKEIVKIHKNTMPFQESPGYESERPAMYVVEVSAGYCGKHKIAEGDRIKYSQINK